MPTWTLSLDLGKLLFELVLLRFHHELGLVAESVLGVDAFADSHDAEQNEAAHGTALHVVETTWVI